MYGDWILRTASLFVPTSARAGWLERWRRNLDGLAVLIDRGEIAGEWRALAGEHCRAAIHDALSYRLDRHSIQSLILSPRAILAGMFILAMVTAAASGGFRFTRSIIALGLAGPNLKLRWHDPFGTFLGYAILIVFAWTVGLVLTAIHRRDLGREGWRARSFFAAKIAFVALVFPAMWLELTPLVKAIPPHQEWMAVLTAALWRAIFICGFAVALGWCLADQRRRCPVCLSHLAMPVSIGSWGSMFDPATTEFLCQSGHGSLSLPETEVSGVERWTPLGESWKPMFRTHQHR